MAISLKFFMIKRGLSIDALVEKSGAKSAEELIDYVKTLTVGVTSNDETDVRNYFTSIAPKVTVDAQDDKPKRRRTKKTGGTDV